MSRIKGKNTRPELKVRKFLHSEGFRYRLHVKLSGKPDIVFNSRKIAIFINGCFWHRHKGCMNYVVPETNTGFWVKKITSNVKRDSKNYKQLIKEGWRIIVIWECQIEEEFKNTVKILLKALKHAN